MSLGVAYRYAVADGQRRRRDGARRATRWSRRRCADGPGVVDVRVDLGTVVRELPRPWRPMIGSEHLSLLLSDETGSAGQSIAADLTSALRAAHDELGVSTVRAHAILCDDLGVYREVDGEPVHDFTGVDATYDALLALGPAARGRAVVHAARPGVGPGRDRVRLRRDRVPAAGLGPLGRADHRPGAAPGRPVRAGRGPVPLVVRGVERAEPRGVLVRHARRVLAPVRRDGARRAGGRRPAGGRRSVDGRRRLGGRAPRARRRRPAHPSTSCPRTPTATRPWTCGRRSRGTGARTPQIWWTEWGVSPTHFGNANDGVFSAAFLVRGMRSAAGRIDALSYWVVSDQFEELAARRGSCTAGSGCARSASCASPGGGRCGCSSSWVATRSRRPSPGDGADSLVEVWASRDDDRSRDRAVERHARPDQGRRVRRAGPHGATWSLTGFPTGSGPSGSRASTPTTRTSRPSGRRCRTAPTGRPTSSGRRCGPPTVLAVTERPLDGHRGRRRAAQPVDRAARAGAPLSSWWRTAVVYQVYVRSFADGDGDGVGDLAGLTARLDAVARLGVDAVWLTPVYRSPQVDHGYDVADHRDIDPLFGDLAGVRPRSSRAAHALGLRVAHGPGAQPRVRPAPVVRRRRGRRSRARAVPRPARAQRLAVDVRRLGVEPAARR